MIYTLDQLHGLVVLADCNTCNGKAAVVLLNDNPDVLDEKTGKKLLPKPEGLYKVTCNGKSGTHKLIEDTKENDNAARE